MNNEEYNLLNEIDNEIDNEISKYNNNKPETIYGDNIYAMSELEANIKELDRKINNLIDNFISIGWYLNKIKENKVFESLGFEDIYDFTYTKYKMSKTTTKNFIAVANKFADKKSMYPTIQSKYKDYSFSQLVELVPEDEDNLENYSPEQSVKEMRLTKLSKNLNSDLTKVIDWFKKDLLNFLENNFKNCKIKTFFSKFGNSINLIYDGHVLYINLYPDKFIRFYGGFISSKEFCKDTIFSIKMVEKIVISFIKNVDEETASLNRKDEEEQKSSLEEERPVVEEKITVTISEPEIVDASPTSDQEEPLNEEIKEEEHKQILKNDKQREEYIRNLDNYKLLYDLKEVNARIYQMKEHPYIFEIQYFGKYYANEEASWKHAEYHFINPDHVNEFGYCLFKHTSQSINVLVDYLKKIKF